MTLPIYIDAFISPVRDNHIAQVAITLVLVLIVLDILFGIINALLHHEFSSEKMRQGIGHKCAELGFILVGICADASILGDFDLGFSAPILVSVCAYLAIMEISSLMETFAKLHPGLAESPLFRLLETTHIIEDSERALVEAMPTETATDEDVPHQSKEVDND